MKNYSLVYSGAIIAIVGSVLTFAGVDYTTGDLDKAVNGLLSFVGFVVTVYGRYRQGDVGVFGNKN